MECPYCQTENRDGVRYCSNCGKFIGATTGNTGSTTVASGANNNSRTLNVGAPLQGGRYVIKKVLGQGGMGAALLATDKRLDNKAVVIKELVSDNSDPVKFKEDERNFKQEVVTLAHLDHPLIPNVTDNFEESSRYFMVQEYVEGENLEDRLDRTGQPMKEREALNVASQVLDVLEYLAQQTPPIVHRDIKPANIIIGEKDKRAHLVDFGIARADVARDAQRKQTSALRTPGYAPPEQYQGNADPRSDLYALAATLHHLVTNRDPRNHPPFTYPPARTLNPQLSPDIERVLTRALTNDINQRYQSAAAMKRDIDDILLKRFGVSGNFSSYTLGTSGPVSTVSAASAPTAPYQPTQKQQQQQSPPRQPSSFSYPPAPAPPSGPPGIGNRPPQQQRKSSNYFVLSFILLLIVLLVIGAGLFAIPYIRSRGTQSTATPGSTAVATATGLPANGIGAFKAPDGEFIGVSDGTFAFAVSGPGGTFKTRAADKLKAGDVISAESLWRSALSNDSGDAESLIYLEDQRVLDAHNTSNTPYITIVVGTMLTGDNASVGRDDLQGAYVIQKEFNDG